MPTLAQISLWQCAETGSRYAEIPIGGSRRKVELPQDVSLWGEILSRELETSTQWIIAQKARENELKREEEFRQTQKQKQRQHITHQNAHDVITSRKGLLIANELLGPRNKNQTYIGSIKRMLEKQTKERAE